MIFHSMVSRFQVYLFPLLRLTAFAICVSFQPLRKAWDINHTSHDHGHRPPATAQDIPHGLHAVVGMSVASVSDMRTVIFLP
jgi:hypothetical protein